MSAITGYLAELVGQEGSRLWHGYVNMLKHFESMFLSPKHWFFEFLQNAEDARADSLLIRVDGDSLSIFNNGKPFSEDDFHAICDVNSRKLPARGFKGYIGIGFKSIFRITDRVSIDSGGYHFKFDKGYWEGKTGNTPLSRWPWEILPIETEARELPRGHTTGFFIPLDSSKGRKVLHEIEEFLSPEEFPETTVLFLQNVQSVEVQTPHGSFRLTKEIEEARDVRVASQNVVRVKKEADDGHKSEERRYLVFRKTVEIPAEVREDEETERVRRSDVRRREIGLVFGLEGNRPCALHGKFAGVYSFLPVEEEQTGVPFGISGDLIPQPGRELIHYSARWNGWMVGEIARLFEHVVTRVFLPRPDLNYTPALLLHEVTSTQAEVNEFWRNALRGPVEKFLLSEALYPDEDGVLRRLSEFIKDEGKIAEALGLDGLRELGKIPHPSIRRYVSGKIKHLNDMHDLLFHERVEQALERIKREPQRLAGLYGSLGGLSNYCITGQDGRDPEPLYKKRFVLGEDGEYHPPDEVVALMEGSLDASSVPGFLRRTLQDFQQEQARRAQECPFRLHPEIARNPAAVDQLRRCYVETVTLDEDDFLRRVEGLIRRITTREECPEEWEYPEDLIRAALYLFSKGERLWGMRLVASDGTLREPKGLIVPGARLEWEPLLKAGLLPGYQTIHDGYLAGEAENREALQGHLSDLDVHGFDADKDKALVETAAYAYAKRELARKGHLLADVTPHRGLGYDIECQGHCNKVFEVKGQSTPEDVTLPESEVRAAADRGENYVLVIVYGLPNHPEKVGYKEIPNPSRKWKPAERAKIPKDTWLYA